MSSIDEYLWILQGIRYVGLNNDGEVELEQLKETEEEDDFSKS